jgi:hypothetical protein
MSTERLEELGVPRRTFLKKATFAALGAPLIVSFGLDAIAEGSTSVVQTKANQCFPNQTFPNQLHPGVPLYNILNAILNAVYESVNFGRTPPLGFRVATAFSDLALQASLEEAADEYLTAYKTWALFISKVENPGGKLPSGLAQELIEEARRAQSLLNCNNP